MKDYKLKGVIFLLVKKYLSTSLIVLFLSSVGLASIVLAAGSADFNVRIMPGPGPQCYDGVDNDGDGLVDYPADPGCSSTSDDDETNVVDNGGGGGGGGGATPPPPITAVSFSGRAYPLSQVTILKDGQIALITIAGPDAHFSATLSGLSQGNYTFAVYSEDANARRSTLFTFPVYITVGATTYISGIYIAPTIAVDKSEVRQGDNISIFGQTAPSSEVTISVHSNPEFFHYALADNDGVYLDNFDTSVLDNGAHNTKSKSARDGQISAYGHVVAFLVGDENVPIDEGADDCSDIRTDINCDRRVNLVDFSILAYWYQRSDVPANVDLNNDSRVNLVDFSIMAYYWTG